MPPLKPLLDTEVSIFANYNTPSNPKQVSLLAWLQSGKYWKEVETIRSISDKAERDRLKAKLPAITPSGLFTYRHSKHLIRHSGFIQIDIDSKGNEDVLNFQQLGEQLRNITNMAYVGLSVSGRGWWGLMPVTHPEKHLSHFLALERDFARHGLQIDTKPKSAASLRGYSFDPEGYFNHDAVPYANLWQPPTYQYKACRIAGHVAERVESCLLRIEAKGIDIAPFYVDWFAVCCALANTFGEQGRGYFHRLSCFYPDYRPQQSDRLYSICLRTSYRYSIGTFFALCDLAGIRWKP